MGCDFIWGSVSDSLIAFQSTHPHGVRRPQCTQKLLKKSFNPRTHMGCDKEDLFILETDKTFQSTHPHGVRPVRSPFDTSQRKFQSTHPHGVRQCLPAFVDDVECVSIHAPTWGATGVEKLRGRFEWLFQSTHPHGVRPSSCRASVAILRFQSTHPHGVRLDALCEVAQALTFQSTHPHGVRLEQGCAEHV